MSLFSVLRVIPSTAAMLMVVLRCYELRVSKRGALAAILITSLVNTALNAYLFRIGAVELMRFQPDTLIFQVVVIALTKGDVFGILFVNFTLNFISNAAGVLAALVLPYGEWLYFVVLYAILTAVVIGIIKFGRKFVVELTCYIKRPFWRVFTLFPFISYYYVKFVFLMPDGWELNPDAGGKAVLLFITAGLVMSVVTVLTSREQALRQAEIDAARSLIGSTEKYYTNIVELQEQLIKLDHDYKIHLRVLSDLEQSGKHDEAVLYLAKLPAELPLVFYTRNAAVNALLNNYARSCGEQDTKFTAECGFPPDSIAAIQYEICIILGNMLDNALLAAAACEGERFIEVFLQLKEGLLGITVRNRFNGEVKTRDGELVSTRGGGVGLQSIKSMTARIGGDFKTQWEGSVFTARAVIELP
jgi:hypothetical protein